MAQRITRLTTDQKIAGSNPAEIDNFWSDMYDTMLENSVAFTKRCAPPGGLEPPTFRLTAERASRLRHGGRMTVAVSMYVLNLPTWLITANVIVQLRKPVSEDSLFKSALLSTTDILPLWSSG